MKKIHLLFIAAALFVASCDNTSKFCVEGTITEAEDSVLYLMASTLDGITKLDSTTLDSDGHFSFRAEAPTLCPEFYALRIGRHVIPFAVDSTETISVSATLPNLERTFTIDGNESSRQIREICLLQQDLQQRMIAIERNDDILPGDKIDSLDAMLQAYKDRMKRDFILPQPQSASAYYAVCQNLTDLRGTFLLFNPLNNRHDVKCYAAVATAWDAAYPDAPRTQQLCNMAIKGMDNTAAPQQQALEVDEDKISETGIIDITLPDVNSKLHSVTELKGKVVLIDFTAYSAKESAQRTRLMRTLYERYHQQGFEIYQISLDEDIHFWKFSCENLPWVCVHETDGTTTNVYGVSSLPTFFLVNRQNEIVLRSDFMKGSLEENLQKLL